MANPTTAAKYPAALLSKSVDLFGEVVNYGVLHVGTAYVAGAVTLVCQEAIPTTYPTSGKLSIDNEILTYTSYTGSTFSGVSGGLEPTYYGGLGSSAAANHAVGVEIDLMQTALQWNQVIADLIAVQTKLGIDASAVTTTVDFKLSGVPAAGKAASVTGTETLTNKTLTAPIIATIVNTGTLTLPTSTDTLVGRATTDTLTNKTLTAPVIATIVNTGTLTLPTSTDTLVGRATTDTLTNKTLTAPVMSTVVVGGLTLTLPSATDTLVGLSTIDVLTNKTLASGTIATTQSPSDNSTKVATTAYVDAAVLGQNYKEAAKYATTAALPASTYANGASGVGATLTEVGLGALSIDGSTPSVSDRVLIKNQVSGFQNGIYTVTVVGSGAASFVLTRATDYNQSSQLKTGDSAFVTNGTVNGATTWAYTGVDSPTIGTTALTQAQTSSGGTPALVLGTTNTPGVAPTFIRTDDTILVFDATVPAAIGAAAAGVATTATRRDHVHPTGAGTPSTQAFADAAAVGTGPAASMTDHKHKMPTAWEDVPWTNVVHLETAVIDTNKRFLAGSGAIAVNANGINLATNATGSSWIRHTTPMDIGSSLVTTMWQQVKLFVAMAAASGSIAAGDTIFMGLSGAMNAAYNPATEKHIGFSFDPAISANWYGTVSNGTTESTLNTGVVCTLNQQQLLGLTFDGTTVTFYVDGVSKGTITTNLPTGQPSTYMSMTFYVDNKAVASDRELNVMTGRAAVSWLA